MRNILLLLITAFLFSCKSTTYYIVRHAEKQQGSNMLSDPPLSAEGEKQALDLKYFLQGRPIKHIYATNYARTLATAEPVRQFFGVNIKIYDPNDLNKLVNELKQVSDGDVLVVGHSNTVDDLVNGLTGSNKLSDLKDDDYGSIFIVKKTGNHYSFEKTKVPKTANRDSL